MDGIHSLKIADSLDSIASSLKSISASLRHIDKALHYRRIEDEPSSETTLVELIDDIAEHLESLDAKGIDTYPQN